MFLIRVYVSDSASHPTERRHLCDPSPILCYAIFVNHGFRFLAFDGSLRVSGRFWGRRRVGFADAPARLRLFAAHAANTPSRLRLFAACRKYAFAACLFASQIRQAWPGYAREAHTPGRAPLLPPPGAIRAPFFEPSDVAGKKKCKNLKKKPSHFFFNPIVIGESAWAVFLRHAAEIHALGVKGHETQKKEKRPC